MRPVQKGCDYLLFDISNLLYRCFYSQKNDDEVTINGMAIHIALTTLNKYFKQYIPHKRVVMAFDCGSWRKQYVIDNCVTTKEYKGNRRQNMTQSQLAKYESFKTHLNEFEQMMRSYTTILTLSGPNLEADDLIAGFVQMHPDDNIVIITADSDMAQLFKHQNVNIVSPITDKPQKLDKFNNDPEYYLYQKCIRGDSTDNIPSAYPRVKQTRIEKSYNDLFERANLMKETWTDQNKKVMSVERMFKDNQALIDLEKQPQDIRDLIFSTIENELKVNKHFSLFHILKFLGRNELVKIKDNIDLYIPLLSTKPKGGN